MKLTSFLTGSVLGAELVKGPFDETGCGKVKSCFRNIDGCNIGDEKCVLFSVQKASDTAIFEVVGTGMNKYAAVGITNTPGMPKTDVYYCINGSGAAPFVQHAYAESKNAPVKKENPAGFIFHDAGRVDNDFFYCRFQRPLSVEFDHGGDSLIFDLNKSVNMLIAKGPLMADNKTPDFHGTPANKDKSAGNAKAFNEIRLTDNGPFTDNGPSTTTMKTMTSKQAGATSKSTKNFKIEFPRN